MSGSSSRVRIIINAQGIDFRYRRRRENLQKRMSEVRGGDTHACFSTHSCSCRTRFLPLQERAFELPQMGQSVRRAAANGLLNFDRLLLHALRNIDISPSGTKSYGGLQRTASFFWVRHQTLDGATIFDWGLLQLLLDLAASCAMPRSALPGTRVLDRTIPHSDSHTGPSLSTKRGMTLDPGRRYWKKKPDILHGGRNCR